MTIHKDGYGTIFGLWTLFGICIFLSLYFIQWRLLSWSLAAIFFLIMVFLLYFFRVPDRVPAAGENIVTSVADGKVVIVDKVIEKEYVGGECIQVSVYMNFFNAHVNFWPVTGEVTYYKYHPGRYMLAFLPKASELNEHTSIGVKNRFGEVFFRQLAGTFARRIVCYAVPGSAAVKGDECGIIKFGSRIDYHQVVQSQLSRQERRLVPLPHDGEI